MDHEGQAKKKTFESKQNEDAEKSSELENDGAMVVACAIIGGLADDPNLPLTTISTKHSDTSRFCFRRPRPSSEIEQRAVRSSSETVGFGLLGDR